MIAYLELEHGMPAGKLLSRSHPTVSFVTHAPPFSLRFGGRYGFLGMCGEERDPFDDLTSNLGTPDASIHGGGILGFLRTERRFDLLAPWRMGDEFVERCRRGVLFYVAVMPPLALLIVVLSLLGLYHEGNFRYSILHNASTPPFFFCMGRKLIYVTTVSLVCTRLTSGSSQCTSAFLVGLSIVWQYSL
jgi:hypothetical protein